MSAAEPWQPERPEYVNDVGELAEDTQIEKVSTGVDSVFSVCFDTGWVIQFNLDDGSVWLFDEFRGQSKVFAPTKKDKPAKPTLAQRVVKNPLMLGIFVPNKGKPIMRTKKIDRNKPCPCGSGKKAKKCCYAPRP